MGVYLFYVLLYVTYVHSSIAIILMGKRELIALLNLSSWCLVMVERLFLAVPRGCLQFVIVVFPDHTYLLILDLSITNGIVSSKIYDQQDDFSFEIVNFPFLGEDTLPMVYIFRNILAL